MFSSLEPWVVPLAENDYRPRLLQSRVVFYAAVVLLLLNAAVAAYYFPFPKNIFFADVTKSELMRLLNEQRQNLDLGILSENQKLDQAARLKAQDMVANGYFSHQSPQGITPWFWFKQAGYSYKYAGENLAVGFADSSILYDAWVNSPSHKANLLNPKYKEVGTAVIRGFGDSDTVVVVQLFGSQIMKNPKPETLNPNQTQNTQVQNAKPVIPAPAPTPVTPAQPAPAPTVLAEASEFPAISSPRSPAQSTWYYRMLNFIVYDNAKLLKYGSYALLLLLIACLLINIFVNIEIQRKGLIFRSLLLIFIMSVAVSINHENVGQLLPHYLIL